MQHSLIKFILTLFVFSNVEMQSFERYEIYCNPILLSKSREVMSSQLGIAELSNRNDGSVCKYLESVGLGRRNPYCAAGQYWCFSESCNFLKYSIDSIPIFRTGLALKMYNHAKAKAIKSKLTFRIDDLVFWQRGNSVFGHTERIIKVMKAGWVENIGFNTKSSSSTKEGVYAHKRNLICVQNRFRIVGIIGFRS